jgi:hypothetical protein
LIGYVTRDPELMQLALMLAKVLDAGCEHAMIVAARWMQDGYAADTALRWVTAGVPVPELAHVSAPQVHQYPESVPGCGGSTLSADGGGATMVR